MEKFTNMILFTVILLTWMFHGETLALTPLICCSKATISACVDACSRMNLPDNELDQLKSLVLTAESCPPQQIAFWKCINSTVPVVQSMLAWSARPCCEHAVNRYCEEACYQATSVSGLVRNCSQTTETRLYKCIEKHEDGEHCCRPANTFNCHLMCKSTHIVNGLGRQRQRHIMRKQCHGVNQPIMQCVQNRHRPVQDSDPELSLPCCHEADRGSECQKTCIKGIQSGYPENVFMDELVKSCGAPKLPSVPIWACFLRTTSSDGVDTGRNIIDGARLQCCSKANSLRCRNLCSRTFSTDWANTHDDFNTKCQSLAAPVLDVILEGPMLSCIAEVDEPCHLGCNGLGFCSNFNNRPTELFRRCNALSDKAARDSLASWQNGTIRLPQMTIPVKDIRECEPDMWKALACALQIKPCNRRATPLPLCREDCFHILNKCVDHSRMKPGYTLQLLCNTLSPGDSRHGSCISVKQYLTESPHKHQAITSPCNPNPCEDGEVCWINRRKCRHPEICLPYVCHHACGMGAATNMYVPKNTYVRIPDAEKDRHNDQCMHYRTCLCGHHGSLEKCKRLSCIKRDHCILGQGHSKRHGEHFSIDCNHCICNSGKILCTQHRCPPDRTAEGWTGLPCDCSRNYSPHCGTNGKTYPNGCIAQKCAKQKSRDLVAGTCSNLNPCIDNPCGDEYRCMAKHRVCLSNVQGVCDQYECVPVMGIDKCERHHHDPVCDTNGDEYTNICLLLAKQKRLAYRGHCQSHCSNTGVVCGHNGEVYDSECAALADRTTVDYSGSCRAVGMYAGNLTTSNNCANVICPVIRPKQCRPITPPGGCCPVCAAEIRVLYSKDLMDVAAAAMHSALITVADILDVLSHQLTAVQCDLYGYLSVENDLVILVKPITPNPTMLLVHACAKEAERLGYLIQTDSPLMKSYLTLTPLLLAPTQVPGVSSLVSVACVTTPSAILTMLLFVFIRTCGHYV